MTYTKEMRNTQLCLPGDGICTTIVYIYGDKYQFKYRLAPCACFCPLNLGDSI